MAHGRPRGDDPADTAAVLDFWERAALAYRGDGTRQAWDTGTSPPYDDATVDALLAGAAPIADDEHRARRQAVQRHPRQLPVPALLRHPGRLRRHRPLRGARASGPHAARARLLPAGRGRLPVVRRRRATCPYHHLTAALVLDDVPCTLHRLRHLEPHARGLPRPPRRLRAVHDRRRRARASCVRCPLDELDGIVAAVRQAQSQHYRNIAAMARDEKIRCGAYVYFTFLRPFAEVAGVADDLDWTVPRDLARAALRAAVGHARARTPACPTTRPTTSRYPGGRNERAAAVASTAGRRARPRARRGAALERVVVLRLRDRDGTLGGYVRLGLYPNLGVAWYWACLVGEDRPLVTVIDHEVPLPERAVARDPRRRACGPTTSSRRRSSTSRLGCEAFAVGVDDPAEMYGACAATGCRSASTSSGRPTASASTLSARPATRSRAPCTARSSWRRDDRVRRHRPARPLLGRPRLVAASAGCWTAGGLDDGTRFHTTASASPASRASPLATCSPPAGRLEQIDICTAEEELGAHGFPPRPSLRRARHGDRAGLQPGPPDRR